MKPPRKRSRLPAPPVLILPHNDWMPRWYQEKYWDYFEGGGGRGVCVAHRRYGKDDIALNWAAVAAHKRKGNIWHLLPEQAQGKKAIWNAVDEESGLRRIDSAFPEHIRRRTNEQEMFIEFLCGSTYQVVGSDNFNSLVGSSPVGVTFSEWPLSNPAAWAYLSPILERNGGWASFIYTPRGKNHGFKFWKTSQTEPGWCGVRQTALETGVFTEQQLEKIKRELQGLYGEEDGENLFQQEYMVSFDVAIVGAYYGRIIARLEQDGRVCRFAHDPSHPVYTGWDIGLDDATAIWFAQIIGREVRIIDYYEARNRALVDIGRDLLAMPYAYAEHRWPHDGDTREITYARTRKETLEGVGLKPIRIGQPRDDAERINAVRQFLPRCVFSNSPRVEKGLEHLRSYHVEFDPKTGTTRQKPKHDSSSHPADAFAELVMQHSDVDPSLYRQRVAQSDYDPLRLGQPDYSRQLARGIPDDYAEDRPWLRQQTVGDYDPFNVK